MTTSMVRQGNPLRRSIALLPSPTVVASRCATLVNLREGRQSVLSRQFQSHKGAGNSSLGHRRRCFGVRASSEAESSEKKPTVGFLGLGIMGFAMARNLVKAGYDVTVWNRSPNKCDALVKEGAKFGASPKGTSAACDITFGMLADPAAAIAVALGEDGVVKGLGPNKGYVDVSTVDAETSKAIAEAVRATGAQFLEAPVSGSKKPAEDGALIFLTAGDRALYEEASAILDVMGKSKFYLGDVGKGAAMKLVVNMVMGSMMASFSEGLVLGEKVGLDPETIVQVIGQGAINAPMFALKGPSMVKSAYPPAFPLKHQQKDLRLALALAEEVSQEIPVAAAANGLFVRAKKDGRGDDDFSAVIEALK
ncbi:hypothetical protein Mapa_006601 [Marchantia paleacea]|nr:hypothetical protein Mapa_006601 [Marchantia paleacea]